MTNAAKIIITLLSIVTVGAIIAGVYIHVVRGRNFSIGTKTVEDTVKFDGEPKAVSVNVDLGNLSVTPGESFSVSYSLPESMVPEITCQNGTLKIESPKGLVTLPLNVMADYRIDVTIPSGSKLDSAKFNLDAGDVNLRDFNAGNLDVHGDAGNINLENMSVSDITATVDAGNVNLKGCSVDRLSVKTDAGNLNIDGSSVHAIDAKTDAGNIKAHDSTIETGKCKTDLGNISLSGNIGDVKTKTSLGNVSVKSGE